MYERTGDRYNLEPEEVQALVEVSEGAPWRVLEKFLHEVRDSYTQELMSSEEPHRVWRGQGGVSALHTFEENVRDVLKMARKEKDGTLEKEPNEERRLY